jgi:aspartate kinase
LLDFCFPIVADRYRGIIRDLGLAIEIEHDLEVVRDGIGRHITPDYAASRGEYLNARIVAKLLGCDFVDAADLIRFDASGRLDIEKTVAAVADTLRNGGPVVVPGFYGAQPDGAIRTFSRGGSDITARFWHAQSVQTSTRTGPMCPGSHGGSANRIEPSHHSCA